MILGKVIGTVVSTRKNANLVGYKLLLIQPYYSTTDDCFVAGDNLGSGIGELVLVTRGSTTQSAIDRQAPVDAFVVGIVDAPPQIGK